MIYLILVIISLTIILYYIYKDYLKILKITGIVTISSGILTFVVGYLVKYFMNNNFSFINVSDVVDFLASKFVFNGICMLILGLIEVVCYFIINYAFDRKKEISSV